MTSLKSENIIDNRKKLNWGNLLGRNLGCSILA